MTDNKDGFFFEETDLGSMYNVYRTELSKNSDSKRNQSDDLSALNMHSSADDEEMFDAECDESEIDDYENYDYEIYDAPDSYGSIHKSSYGNQEADIAETKSSIKHTPVALEKPSDSQVQSKTSEQIPAPKREPISELNKFSEKTEPKRLKIPTDNVPRQNTPAKAEEPHKPETNIKTDVKRPIKRTAMLKRAAPFRSDAPFISSRSSPRSVTADIIIATLPLLIWALYVFGARVLAVIAVSVLSCTVFELWFEYLIRRRITVTDLSSVTDGLFIALLMPASVPLWIPIVAAFFGTVIIKCLFGGRGRNILQPSLAGFALVSLIFSRSVGAFTQPLSRLPISGLGKDTLASLLSEYPLSAVSGESFSELSYTDMIIGLRPGSIGEISVLLLAVALIYLLVRRTISWHIPLSFIAVSTGIFYLIPQNPVIGKFTAEELLCGLIPLCAVFFASDFGTSPVFGTAKLIYGAACGALTVLLRYLGVGIYSAVYAVLIMNLLARPLDMLFISRSGRGARKENADMTADTQNSSVKSA